MPFTVRRLGPDAIVGQEGETRNQCTVIIDGMLASYHELRSGKRQIVAFHFAGCIPDLHNIYVRESDHTIAAVGSAVVASVPATELERVFRNSYRLASLMWRVTFIEAAVYRQWITNVGAREAICRMSHLLAELAQQAKVAGRKGPDGSFALPLTQYQIGEALGLSSVHVNRITQRLRQSGLIKMDRGRLTIIDWNRLRAVGDFNDEYLHSNHISAQPSYDAAALEASS